MNKIALSILFVSLSNVSFAKQAPTSIGEIAKLGDQIVSFSQSPDQYNQYSQEKYNDAISKIQSAVDQHYESLLNSFSDEEQKDYFLYLKETDKNSFRKELKNIIDFDGYPKKKIVLVNVPNFNLYAMTADYDDDGELYVEDVLTSRVVVGKNANSYRTPNAVINITWIKFNPTWTPTPSMIKREFNSSWLSRFKVYDSNGKRVYSVPYNKRMNYRFVQSSGGRSALGLLKFETDSKNNIYLHDTPSKKLFNNSFRAYSHGCVRVKEYDKLAAWVFNDADHEEGLKTVKRKIKQGRTFIDRLDSLNQPTVIVTHLNQFVNDSGELYSIPKVY